jgi:hypothetical protein
MEKIEFKVQGREDEPYTVTINKVGSNLSAECTCAAGTYGSFCKHRVNIIKGNKDGIVSTNLSELPIVKKWFTGTIIEKNILEIEKTEAEIETLNKKVKGLKKQLSENLIIAA